MSTLPALQIGTNGNEILRAPRDQRAALAQQVNDSGLDHLFIADHISFHDGMGMDGLINAAILTTLCPKLSVCVGVYLLALRHPLPVARQIASICESAPGRLVMGIGVGGEDRHEIEICGVDPRTRGKRTNETLDAVIKLLSGAPVSAENEFFAFDDAVIKEAPTTPVPFLIGGRSDAAITRAARYGDGWLGVWVSPRRFREAIGEANEQAEQFGRAESCRTHGMQFWAGIDDTREKARAKLARRMEAFYKIPFEKFERTTPYGTPEQVAEQLAEWMDAGCRYFNVEPVGASESEAAHGMVEVAEYLRRNDPAIAKD